MLIKLFNPSPRKGGAQGGNRQEELPPYALRDAFLSAAELHFYHTLAWSIPEGCTLLSKVRLSDLFYVKRPQENRGAMNRIHMKHVDFILCNAQTMQPLLGIELDDKSHQRSDRKARDQFVDAVFAKANLPLLHVPAASGYDQAALQQLILSTLNPIT